ncbi:unnamed protein product [Prorocentrum cordatum]|uniref:Uncharacterized protein n=1 Tax=Prorocentrum cordatum TaxID=2364126 RepID=A0ABN9Q4A4_9DINO|nr:unnamed protein product [Polarella glacialis]
MAAARPRGRTKRQCAALAPGACSVQPRPAARTRSEGRSFRAKLKTSTAVKPRNSMSGQNISSRVLEARLHASWQLLLRLQLPIRERARRYQARGLLEAPQLLAAGLGAWLLRRMLGDAAEKDVGVGQRSLQYSISGLHLCPKDWFDAPPPLAKLVSSRVTRPPAE